MDSSPVSPVHIRPPGPSGTTASELGQNLIFIKGDEFELWYEITNRGVHATLPKTGNHAQLFASCGMSESATKSQVTLYVSKIMVQCLKEYEDADGKFDPTFHLK